MNAETAEMEEGQTAPATAGEPADVAVAAPLPDHPVDHDRVRAIGDILQEPNLPQIERTAAAVGMERVEELLQETLAVEAAGGMLAGDGVRRRTPGGVFFQLARRVMPPKPPKPAPPPTPPKAPKPRPTKQRDSRSGSPSLNDALGLLRAAVSIPADKKGPALVKITVIGRPKQFKTMETCTMVVMGLKAPPPMPRGLPPVPDTSKATVTVFVENRQWSRVESALKANPRDELIAEGYPVNDVRNQLTGVWAVSCTTKGMERARRERPLIE